MHITEGMLTATEPLLLRGGIVLAAGAALTVAGTAVAVRRMRHEQIPRVGLMAAVFFVGSLIHVPVPPSSAHLVLNGLAGMLLGWSVFPALLLSLLLQAVFFQFGGLTTLGLSTFAMAAPALLFGSLLRGLLRRGPRWAAAAGFLCGCLSILGAAVLTGGAMVLASESFLAPAGVLVVAHLPVGLIEGLITGSAAAFLVRTRPALLGLEAHDAST
jgi:cobalt/nickel transport system permease protein